MFGYIAYRRLVMQNRFDKRWNMYCFRDNAWSWYLGLPNLLLDWSAFGVTFVAFCVFGLLLFEVFIAWEGFCVLFAAIDNVLLSSADVLFIAFILLRLCPQFILCNFYFVSENNCFKQYKWLLWVLYVAFEVLISLIVCFAKYLIEPSFKRLLTVGCVWYYGVKRVSVQEREYWKGS